MRKISTLILIALIAWIAVPASPISSASIVTAAPSPKVVMDESRHEFGDVYAGEQFFHVFIVHNAGTVPLELTEGKPTSPKLPPDPHQKSSKPAQTPPGEAVTNQPGSSPMLAFGRAHTQLTSARSWIATPAFASSFHPGVWSPAPS
jgi:hypothetical protein